MDRILTHFHSGKNRDTYRLPDGKLLVVASDRLSTHNVVHRTSINNKGKVLTALTVFWNLEVLQKAGIPTHIVAFGQKIYEYLPPECRRIADLHHRAIVVQERKPILKEFIWRWYLTGSLYKEYLKGNDPYGLNLPPGLPHMYRFSHPVFTPTEKSEDDEPCYSADVRTEYPAATARSLRAFRAISEHLLSRGVTLIDAKFEADADLMLDEWGNGDCCRMARTSDIKEGVAPPWLDKQVARDIAEHTWGDGEKVPLTFTSGEEFAIFEPYAVAVKLITGSTLIEYTNDVLDK
ncbi:hypothetical protein KKH15_01125 [Patescibacteria group bacterium]|nr:hypothetical protein [Patescibacteria group bacterium]MBU1755357.1 hypothetical protein [Patescibacteria group bacterium]